MKNKMNKYIALYDITIGKYQFIKGNVYSGTRINDNWYCIDSVGVNAETFNVNFKYETKDK